MILNRKAATPALPAGRLWAGVPVIATSLVLLGATAQAAPGTLEYTFADAHPGPDTSATGFPLFSNGGLSEFNAKGQALITSRTVDTGFWEDESHLYLSDPRDGATEVEPLGGWDEPWGREEYVLGGQLNDRGQVAGTSTTDATGEFHAYLWSASDGSVDLGTLGGTSSASAAINDRGQVAGTARTAAGDLHAFHWDSRTGMTDLGTLGGTSSSVSDMNNRGQVVGVSETASGERHVFIWDARRGMTDLGVVYGSSLFRPLDVNERGQVVGVAGTTPSEREGFFWDRRSGVMDLGTVVYPRYWYQGVLFLNNAGQVAGTRITGSGESHAFRWHARTGMTDLGTLGGDSSQAQALNARGQVVGSAQTASGESHAFAWHSRTGMVDLDPVGGRDSYAVALNNRGRVAGTFTTGCEDGPWACGAFAWGRRAGLVELGGQGTNARSIDRAGRVLGAWDSDNSETAGRAAIWTPGRS